MTIPPAQIFVGPHYQAIQEVDKFLQALLCKNNSCSICINCVSISAKQHHSIQWFYPEKNYTLDSLQDIFNTLYFQREPHELFFFIIQKADFLTTLCANKLLKPMEEPSLGYHFILITESIENLPLTIRSRCVIHLLPSIYTQSLSHPLYEVFTHKFLSIQQFSQLLDNTNINERETVELLNAIVSYWFSCYQETDKTIHEQNKIRSIIDYLQKAQSKLPMPGSSHLFWRNIYMNFNNLFYLGM